MPEWCRKHPGYNKKTGCGNWGESFMSELVNLTSDQGVGVITIQNPPVNYRVATADAQLGRPEVNPGIAAFDAAKKESTPRA